MPSIRSFNQYSGYARIADDSSQEIVGEENIICYGYKSSTCKKIIFNTFAVLLLGIPYLFLHWYCQFKAYMKYRKCSLEEAEILLIEYSIQQVNTTILHWPGSNEVRNLRYFYHNLLKYIWNDEINGFMRLHGLDNGSTCLSHIQDNSHGFTADQQQQMPGGPWGKNLITINVKSYWKLFIEEVFNPFYIFQAFSVTLWSLDEYYYYASCIVVLTAASIITSLVQTRKQSEALRDLVAASNTRSVTVIRNGGAVEEIPASCLVPGDLLMIPPHGCLMACDAVLLNGNCIVNESMLTGESVPVTKTPPPHSDEYYDPVTHKRYTLFSGTQVIQTRFYEKNK
ncbi:hypothetical protein L9F63_023340, partial [Diploptera punctata]